MSLVNYQLNQIAYSVFELVGEEGAELSLRFNDVFNILSYQKDYFEQMSFSGKKGSIAQVIQFIRINANLEGKSYTEAQIKEVLQAEERFLREMNIGGEEEDY